MTGTRKSLAKIVRVALISTVLVASSVNANNYREKGKAVLVAKSQLEVTPPQDWNRLSIKVGKNAETWTLDGEQLNDITFYGGIAPSQPLVKERNKKRDPLPKVAKGMLLIDIPDLLEGTYRAHKQISVFKVTSTEPTKFLESDGVNFAYEYVDGDNLTRLGEARATLINGKLYMATFDAPRLHYFAQGLDAYRALIATAKLQ